MLTQVAIIYDLATFQPLRIIVADDDAQYAEPYLGACAVYDGEGLILCSKDKYDTELAANKEALIAYVSQ